MDLLNWFHGFYDLPAPDFHLLEQNLKNRTYRKGDLMTTPGQVQRELFFVLQGVQMSYHETEERQYVIAFTYHPGPCALPESFSFQTPSRYYLKCLTDSEFLSITFEALQKVFEKSQHVERLFRKITEAILAGMINRHVELQSLTMEERYRAFCSRSPHLLQLVPHKYIASYLGIDSTNFSKLYNSVRI